jgi:hypothetical protein
VIVWALASIANVLLANLVSVFSVAVLSRVVSAMERLFGWSRGAIIGMPIAAGLQIVAQELTANRRARIAAADVAERQQRA